MIQYKTVKTPRITQIVFVVFLIIMMTPFFVYVASASPLDNYCERQFQQSFRYNISPLAYKKCETRFNIITDQWVGFTINK